mmetsp:Transcript_98374/g.188752  ORF Transcript_98374/g.188752 Transcript_98374/m.188752 type:complete len:282 (+) Transcript_98374:71-916(+)
MSFLLIALSCCLSNNAWAASITSTVQHQRGNKGHDAQRHLQPSRGTGAVNHTNQTKQMDVDTSQTKKSVTGPMISVELYYETRCPDCTSFLSQTLGPLWQDLSLRSSLNLTMYPYGNAMVVPVSKISEGYKFWHPKSTGAGFESVAICQHGADECFGNLIQACAIHTLPQETYMALIFCMASHPDYSMEKASYECMQNNSIDPKKIKDCVQSPKGNELITNLAEQTASVPGRNWTPWIMIDGQHLSNQTALVPTICTKVSEMIAEAKSEEASLLNMALKQI